MKDMDVFDKVVSCDKFIEDLNNTGALLGDYLDDEEYADCLPALKDIFSTLIKASTNMSVFLKKDFELGLELEGHVFYETTLSLPVNVLYRKILKAASLYSELLTKLGKTKHPVNVYVSDKTSLTVNFTGLDFAVDIEVSVVEALEYFEGYSLKMFEYLDLKSSTFSELQEILLRRIELAESFEEKDHIEVLYKLLLDGTMFKKNHPLAISTLDFLSHTFNPGQIKDYARVRKLMNGFHKALEAFRY